MSGACGRWMLSFIDRTSSFPPPRAPSFLSPPCPFLTFVPIPFLECHRHGAAGRLRRRLRSGRGSHHVRDRAESRRLSPLRPARSPAPWPTRPTTPSSTLPTGPGAPQISGMSEGVGGGRVGRAWEGGAGEEVWRRQNTPKMCSG